MNLRVAKTRGGKYIPQVNEYGEWKSITTDGLKYYTHFNAVVDNGMYDDFEVASRICKFYFKMLHNNELVEFTDVEME
jgi:hypothetical protein